MKEHDYSLRGALDRRGFRHPPRPDGHCHRAHRRQGTRLDWQTPTRYPGRMCSCDPAFAKYKLGNTPIRRLYTNPTCFGPRPEPNGVSRYLLWSDIPNNVQLRWLEEDGHVSTFVIPAVTTATPSTGPDANSCNGNRRVVRYEYNGKITVLADGYGSKPFNAPNDAVVHPDGAIWFTDLATAT